jgi:hypothetical protein
MSIDDDDETAEDTEDFSTPAIMDPLAVAIAFNNFFAEGSRAYKLVTTDKAKAAALRAADKADRRAAAAEQKFAAITAQAKQVQAALDARAAELDEQARALDARRAAFENELADARDNLRAYYDSIAEADRHVRYRVLSHAGLLSGYNPQLQDLPSWDQLRRLVVGLPEDPPIERDVSHPRIDAFADVCSDPGSDRHGAPFLGELTRDVSHHKRGAA